MFSTLVGADRLRDHDDLQLDEPAEHHLCHGLPVLASDVAQDRVREEVVPAFGERPPRLDRHTALRALHEQLPVADCPFSWSVDHRLGIARRAGIEVPADLPEAPPVDHLVVCHGDPCAPNTLLPEEGSWSAHVDLGALGVADRWADLAAPPGVPT